MKIKSTAPKASNTSKFYDDLMNDEEKRGILGKDARYNPKSLRQKKSLETYFTNIVKQYISKSDNVLDFGCGPGTFSSLIAPLCNSITGVDISEEFTKSANNLFSDLGYKNAKAIHILPGNKIPREGSYDTLIMIDVIHHLENIEETLITALSSLKPGGRIIILEPNKLNPMMYLLHYIDKNERGLLALGTPSKYKKLLTPYIKDIGVEFNGIVIGPQSKLYDFISYVLNLNFLNIFIGWLNPKIFITGIKK